MAIDGDANDSAVSGGDVKPGPSNVHGGDGPCINQVAVPTAPPSLVACDKFEGRQGAVSERHLLQLLKIPALDMEAPDGVREGGASQHCRLRLCDTNIYVSLFI